MDAHSNRRLRSLVAIALAMSGCLLNSSYLTQKAAQKNVAQQQMPHALQGTPSNGDSATSARRVTKVLRIRVHATAAYAAEVVDWPHQFARLLEDVNRVVEPTLEARLELADASTWSPSLSNDDLNPLLTSLRRDDEGNDVDCVVGLVGSLPVFAHSFHQLGLGQVLGKHLVVRAMNDAREREALEVELSRLSADEREALYQTRKRHKATSVFLHELGHNFGAIHETDTSFIMNARYDKSMTAFSPESVEVMHVALEHRSKGGGPEREGAERLLGLFERTEGRWVAAERETMLASLKVVLAQPASTASSEAALADESALRDVKVEDRAVFASAVDDDRQGKPREAWAKGEPLFSRYPEVYAVQNLHCKLAMELSTVWEFTRTECEALMNLSRGKRPTKK
jgi:hypothetical protein